jgi:hypothetical protein
MPDLLQIGWFSVATFFATQYILQAFCKDTHPRTFLFAAVAIVRGLVTGFVGAKGMNEQW